jgi:hypothetical protein
VARGAATAGGLAAGSSLTDYKIVVGPHFRFYSGQVPPTGLYERDQTFCRATKIDVLLIFAVMSRQRSAGSGSRLGHVPRLPPLRSAFPAGFSILADLLSIHASCRSPPLPPLNKWSLYSGGKAEASTDFPLSNFALRPQVSGLPRSSPLSASSRPP